MNQYFLVGIDDPTKKETFAPKGALYLRAGDLGGAMYQKQDDGASINWKLVGGIEIDLGSGVADLIQILSNKENIGVAAQQVNALESKLIRHIDTRLAQNDEKDVQVLNAAITQMNQTIEQVLSQTVNNRIQTFFIDKEKDFNGLFSSLKNQLEASILQTLANKVNNLNVSITDNVTTAVKASSESARNILVQEFREQINQKYQNFKIELLALSEDKIKQTYDSICALAVNASKESYDKLADESKKQTDLFVEKSQAFLQQSSVNYDVISNYLKEFETGMNNRIANQIAASFDVSKKDFYDRLKQEFTIAINKASQELQIYVNSKVNG